MFELLGLTSTPLLYSVVVLNGTQAAILTISLLYLVAENYGIQSLRWPTVASTVF